LSFTVFLLYYKFVFSVFLYHKNTETYFDWRELTITIFYSRFLFVVKAFAQTDEGRNISLYLQAQPGGCPATRRRCITGEEHHPDRTSALVEWQERAQTKAKSATVTPTLRNGFRMKVSEVPFCTKTVRQCRTCTLQLFWHSD